MFKGDYKWQHDYVRLATDTGFTFEKLKSDSFDNKISVIDINNIIDQRDFATIEESIPNILKFVLDSEHAQILDKTFVKIFLLSQLAIQYLLFCKKYLDNSLILVKQENKNLKQEIDELNLFINDLKEHISKLMKEIEERPTFVCAQCNKVFSTEEFLASHVKRRHSITAQVETDKLQMEIKELKGRLNDAEKTIYKEEKETEWKKVEELQQKFEELRVQVQSELKLLQAQHNYQEKYEKLFEKLALQNSKVNDQGGGDLAQRRESTTQTELEMKFEDMDKENVPMRQVGEVLETKVTTSLQKIEHQMQGFWSKLNEMEKYKKDNEKPRMKPLTKAKTKFSKDVESDEFEAEKSEPLNNHGTKFDASNVEKEQFKPKLKGRFTVANIANNEENTEHVSKLVTNNENRFEPTINLKTENENETPVQQLELDAQNDNSISETITSETEKSVQKPQPLPRRRQLESNVENETKMNIINDDLLKHFSLEIEQIIVGRLQDLGVSPDWKGLPELSFQRAMEIVHHQRSLIKKTHLNFDYILTQLEKTVSRKIEESQFKKPQPPTQCKGKFVESNRKIKIKNRKMYETDSDSEIKPSPVQQSMKRYSAVIEELKTLNATTELKNEEQAKGVLKSFPSVGSLTKKKVLFNLNEDDGKKNDGSSTSIASSVFDPTPRKEKVRAVEKDIEDLSDFDFSDL